MNAEEVERMAKALWNAYRKGDSEYGTWNSIDEETRIGCRKQARFVIKLGCKVPS
jgi:hypothetical protein